MLPLQDRQLHFEIQAHHKLISPAVLYDYHLLVTKLKYFYMSMCKIEKLVQFFTFFLIHCLDRHNMTLKTVNMSRRQATGRFRKHSCFTRRIRYQWTVGHAGC